MSWSYNSYNSLPPFFHPAEEVALAISRGKPMVALESTVITHGLPYPENLQVAQDMEWEVRQREVTPATIAVLDGLVRVGLSQDQLERLATGVHLFKISSRDLAGVVAMGESGGTTVAGTLVVAHITGIRVFATGGIGGVHREAPTDISADLYQLSSTPMIVVCAGAKAILDLPATLEFLETYNVPVVGYRCDEFPAFFSKESGLSVSVRADSVEQVAAIARAHWGLGLRSAVLVVQPPPDDVALPMDTVEVAIRQSLEEARAARKRGQEMTPYLLNRVRELTGGASLQTNLGLLRNNARLAASVARFIFQDRRLRSV